MLNIPFVEDWFKNFRTGLFEDKVDRLHYHFTTRVLLLLALMAGVKNYFGTPLSCWMPPHFTDSLSQYVRDLCFVESTYFEPIDKQVPQDVAERERGMQFVAYYQWVPIILATQALLIYLPNFIWSYLNFKRGKQVKKILAFGRKAANVETSEEDRAKCLAKVISGFRQTFGIGKQRKTSLDRIKPPSCVSYICIKALYLANVIFQLCVLNRVVGSKYSYWGIETLADILAGRQWKVSGQFPRVALCDFEVRTEISNIHRHTVQCVLNINILNEKIFIFVWLWLALMAVVTAANLAYWIVVVCAEKIKTSFVKQYVDDLDDDEFEGRNDRIAAPGKIFAKLELDALILLRFLESRADGDVCKAIIADIWMAIQKKERVEELEPFVKNEFGSGVQRKAIANAFQAGAKYRKE